MSTEPTALTELVAVPRHAQPTQSIFQIESQLTELMALREEMSEAGEDCSACDCEIAEYVKLELRKCDGIRAYLRHCDMMADAAAAEAKRLSALAHSWKARRERLMEFCRQTMEFFGAKRIEGQSGSLLLKGNGGLAPLIISDESLVPRELCDYSGTLPESIMLTLERILRVADQEWMADELHDWLKRTPNNARIREALKSGPVAGCRLEERGNHVEVR